MSTPKLEDNREKNTIERREKMQGNDLLLILTSELSKQGQATISLDANNVNGPRTNVWLGY